MVNEIRVSVIMVTYNHEKFIKKAIEGVLMQEVNFDIELIIADDCSPDNTQKVVEELLKNHPKAHAVKYTKHLQNKGMQPNFIWAYQQCNGKYIAICEGDDYWTDPLKLEKQVDFLENNDQFGLVYTDVNKVDSKNNLLENNFLSLNQFSKLNDFEDFLILAPFRAPCTWLFRKDLLDINYLNNDKIIGDLTVLLNISSKAATFFMRDVTANYKVLDSSASHFKDKRSQYIFNQNVLKTQLYFAKNTSQVDTLVLNFVKTNFRNFLKFGSNNKDYFLKNAKKFPLHKRLLIYLKTVL